MLDGVAHVSGRRQHLGILVFTPNYPGVNSEGGIGTYTRDLGRGLAALGHRVIVLTPGDGPPLVDDGVEVHQVRLQRLRVADSVVPGFGSCWSVARTALRLVREKAVDIVEFPNWEGLGVLFQRMAGVPVVVRLHTSSKETQEIDRLPQNRCLRWDVRRERWQGRQADVLVTHSQVHREAMSKELGVPQDRIRLIPHGVPTFPGFHRTYRTSGPHTVVYLGRLETRKGTLPLLNAVPDILERFPETRFVLIGSDRAHCPGNRTHSQYLEDEFPAEVRRRVQIMGRLPQDDVDRWLQEADVFVAPSLYESFGLIFVEAMRWGTPVVGTRAGGIPEIVTDNETGVLVEPGQTQPLALAIKRLLGDDALRSRLGRAGRLEVETRFTAQRVAEDMAALYTSVLSQGTPR